MAQNSDQPPLDATFVTSAASEGGSTQPRSEQPPWQPFSVSAWPSQRQQELLSEQSGLLHEQFVQFGRGLERLHNMSERIWEDLSLERQQRVRGEEQGFSSLAVMRDEFSRKQELMLKHVDESLMSTRAEIGLRAGACNDEIQRLSRCVDGLAADTKMQLTGVLEEQRGFCDELRSEMHGAIKDGQAWWETSLKSLASKSQLEDEMLQRRQSCLRIEARIEEVAVTVASDRHDRVVSGRSSDCFAGRSADCLAGLAGPHPDLLHQQATLELSRKDCEALEVSVKEVKELLLSRIESVQVTVSAETQRYMEAVSHSVGENSKQCLNTLRDEECRRLAGDEALRLCTQDTAALFARTLAATDEKLSEQISGIQAESACEAESVAVQLASVNSMHQQLLAELGSEAESLAVQLASSNSMHQQLLAELGSERQQRSASATGLVAEMREVRSECECQARKHEERHEELWHVVKDRAGYAFVVEDMQDVTQLLIGHSAQ